MSAEIGILLLRLASAGCLLLFAGAVGYMLWRDTWRAAQLVAARHHQSARLIVVESQAPEIQVGQSWSLAPVTTLGRAPGNTIALIETTTAGYLALLLWCDDRWWLQDLNGGHGVLLNSTAIKGPTALAPGDIISCGQVQLRLELD